MAGESGEPLTLTRELSKLEQDAASGYWTRERITAAPAFPIPTDNGDGAIDPAAPNAEDAGELSWSGPRAGAWDAEIVAQSAYWRDWLAVEDESAAEEDADATTGTAGIYTYYDVNTHTPLWNIYPHRWIGRLNFVTPAGGSSCSAAVLTGNTIVTAAHCVYDTTANRFFSGWVFTPAYRNGGTPFGTFTASACTVLNSWVNLTGSFNISTWSRHDVAVCSLNRNSANQTINQAVGNAGRMWNAGNAQQIFNAGYPQRTYTDALISGATQYLRACTAETFLYTTNTLGSGCFWGRGHSGGPWMVQYKPFMVSGFVNGVNSGLVIGQQNLYGARFNNNNIVVLCSVRGC